MLILGVETSTARGSVAVYDSDNDRVLADTFFPDEPSHARDIVPAINAIFTEGDITKEEVSGVAVSQGPGSFTGLRIGITCAKTLAYVLQWKCVGISSLEIMAHNLEPTDYADSTVCPLRNARRSAVYGTLYRSDGNDWVDETGVMLDSPSAVADRLPVETLVFGDGTDAYPDVFAPPPDGSFKIGDNTLAQPNAVTVARLGNRHMSQGNDVSPMELNPKYYRQTAAEDNIDS
ncbi:MAG: tRNA (adenosine(37)-N6)-threonylcarbamoyltransferase complex dimerization subunit type 1 TsaB [Planctomycetota bacterium]